MFTLSIVLLCIASVVSGYLAVTQPFPIDFVAQVLCIASSCSAVGMVGWRVLFNHKEKK